jgi:deoxycytidylate deaminase
MADVLKGLGFRRYRMSDAIREEAKRRGKGPSKGTKDWRKKLQDLGDRRRKEDRRYWVDKVFDRMEQDGIGQQSLVVDGIRNCEEVSAFRERFPSFFLVAVCAGRDNRWKRVREDYGGDEAQFQRDDRRDKDEGQPWGQCVQRCVDDADYVYSNDRQLVVEHKGKERAARPDIHRELERQANEFVPLMRGEQGKRPPTPEEVEMAAAYALSNASSCTKRHVGAVITVEHEGRELPISMGYNENPAGTQRCIDNGGCVKDRHMASWFSALERIHCPSCGTEVTGPAEDSRCPHCGDSLQEWLRPTRGMELCTAVHAEERAIRSLGDRSAENGTLYVTTFPCFQCSRMVLDVGIKRLVYVEAYPGIEAAKFLTSNGCAIQPFKGFTARSFFRVFRRVS